MNGLPYRTHTTWLTDDDLLLLDVMFDCCVGFRHVRRDNYELQWNLPYTHSYEDDYLETRLKQLCELNVLQENHFDDHSAFGFTPHGGDLWSQERCPDWDRYCIERYKETSQDRMLISVVAFSSKTRDDFLRLWPTHFSQISPDHPVRRRRFTIRNHLLIPWLPMQQLHAGVATCVEVREWESGAESIAEAQQEIDSRKSMERRRTWWREITELQRFVPRDA